MHDARIVEVTPLRIVSLLPSATEILCCLGLADQLVGISHECDYPSSISGLPRVTHSLLPSNATSSQIDQAVRERWKTEPSLYALNGQLLADLKPDLIVTQTLCNVCAVPASGVQTAIRHMTPQPAVLNLEPSTLSDIFESIRQVGIASNCERRAEATLAELEERVERVTRTSCDIEMLPTVVLLEWIDPPFSAGHWNPELVARAGGEDFFKRGGQQSIAIQWEQIVAADPEVLVIACCGFDVPRTLQDLPTLQSNPQWSSLTCVQTGRVYVVDGSAYFNRPGPRIVDSLELLAHALHPTLHPRPTGLPPLHSVSPQVPVRVLPTSAPRTVAWIGGTAILPDRLLPNSTVLCRNGRITAVSEREEIPDQSLTFDVRGKYVSPGFVDIHVHGGDGADFMDGQVEAVEQVCRAHLRRGTTTIFPTTTTGTPQQILAMIAACQSVALCASNPELTTGLPNLPGVHLYGPYFAEDKVGCHSSTGRRSPTRDENQAYFDTQFVRIATCAAELPGASEFYQMARQSHCLITCGHSNSSWGEMLTAFEHGMRHVDHFWCAMSSVPSLRKRFNVPMQASMAEFVLMHEDMSTEVIADGFHLAPELLEFAYRMKGATRLCLVTDANRALGMPAGEYRFGNRESGSWLYSDGQVGWSQDRQSLASSIVGLDHMVRHMHAHTSASLPEIIRMASLTPAERAGVEQNLGSLSPGKQADLLILDSQLSVEQVYVRGQRCGPQV
ncbi:amidohydrolase family protein [Aureliella helgolandensis]|uniref:N-acetylglucosamine-6-phosphate deacetylase n=1 Tax=Aureliella helgolandensis TaxID=2527968 RepID=A0A518GA41_9BACT|nr:amidohydrolase family protein [Aureliella helgolandensis]QDV25461.1 N-acetylglucosamine-6-phosphate deacetylase [Aureliella helgolandensis]